MKNIKVLANMGGVGINIPLAKALQHVQRHERVKIELSNIKKRSEKSPYFEVLPNIIPDVN